MTIDKETCELLIDDYIFQLDEYDEINDRAIWETELSQLLAMNFSIDDFLENLYIQTRSNDGFGTGLFYDFEFFKRDNKFEFVFICRQPNKYWEGQWGLSTLLSTLADVIKDSPDFIIDNNSLDIEDDWKTLEVAFQLDKDFEFKEIILKYSKLLNDLIKRTELILSGAVWRKEYETDEKLFCTEIIFPLLRKMDFIDVRFNHGVREYGKDFTFSEITKFGNLRHFAIQAKAGNLRGNVNSDIDEILGQLDDAFTMPYYEVSANESRNISTFIVAISGHFTENAKDKLIQKIPQHFKGCVYLIDRDKTLELIERFWK